MAKSKVKFVCKDCGNDHPKWQGKCNFCGEWNTLVEETAMTGKAAKGSKSFIQESDSKPEKLKDIQQEEVRRFSSGYSELDRVLGGGIVEGSMVLIGGEPGQGKSTLLLQSSTYLANQKKKIYYFTGEESKFQTKLRATRLNTGDNDMYVMHTRNIEEIEHYCEKEKPDLIIVDSIQTTGDPDVASIPGSVNQVRTVTSRLMVVAKQKGITTFIIGQVTKDGDVAGPKNLEHMVDTVLYLEGDHYNDLKQLRVTKNRFGSELEMGIFRMVDDGLQEVKNPSEYLLANREKSESGSAIVCITDNRPLLVELQCLVSPPNDKNPNPRRTTEGFSRNRLSMMATVLERRLRIPLTYKDIYVNVVGGIPVKDKERGADLGLLVAMYSSEKDIAVDQKDTQTLFLGEVGLTGEVRAVPGAERIVKEAERTGFTDCYLSKSNYEAVKHKAKIIRLHPVSTVKEAIETAFKGK